MKERFELSLLGGAVERRWRRVRPDIERLPWDALDRDKLPEELVAAGRHFWTVAAFQEHRTGASCAATLQGLIAARAPVDLIAVAARFVEDEMAHVELCARVAAQLGGGAPLVYDPALLVRPAADDKSPLAAVAERVLRTFCVGEAFSVPMQRATARAEKHPLLRALIRRIAKDEAAHGAFGWIFFDWAGEKLDDATRRHLGTVAHQAVAEVERTLPSTTCGAGARLGWLEPKLYAAEASRALEEEVIAPLRARGLF